MRYGPGKKEMTWFACLSVILEHFSNVSGSTLFGVHTIISPYHQRTIVI